MSLIIQLTFAGFARDIYRSWELKSRQKNLKMRHHKLFQYAMDLPFCNLSQKGFLQEGHEEHEEESKDSTQRREERMKAEGLKDEN